jgi:hypothetical protein
MDILYHTAHCINASYFGVKFADNVSRRLSRYPGSLFFEPLSIQGSSNDLWLIIVSCSLREPIIFSQSSPENTLDAGWYKRITHERAIIQLFLQFVRSIPRRIEIMGCRGFWVHESIAAATRISPLQPSLGKGVPRHRSCVLSRKCTFPTVRLHSTDFFHCRHLKAAKLFRMSYLSAPRDLRDTLYAYIQYFIIYKVLLAISGLLALVIYNPKP